MFKSSTTYVGCMRQIISKKLLRGKADAHGLWKELKKPKEQMNNTHGHSTLPLLCHHVHAIFRTLTIINLLCKVYVTHHMP